MHTCDLVQMCGGGVGHSAGGSLDRYLGLALEADGSVLGTITKLRAAGRQGICSKRASAAGQQVNRSTNTQSCIPYWPNGSKHVCFTGMQSKVTALYIENISFIARLIARGAAQRGPSC